ncbi:MAG: Oxidoreductase FAD/NAD(P)-binding protein [uncultured bacterium]|nr:MAG: Oxidoreductase FAD/NAD(P)-binding protein [uncultured bacterium]
MKNIYKPRPAKIIAIRDEALDVKSFVLRYTDPDDQKNFFFIPGQFLMFSIPGFGEAPLGYGSCSCRPETFEICVRKAGKLTGRLHESEINDIVGVRGPLGRGFPMKELKSKNVLLVAGGIGIIPLRAVILDYLENPDNYKDIQLLYGAKCERDFLYKKELETWKDEFNVHLTVDKREKNNCGLKCDEGLITKLFETKKIIKDPLAFVIGPPVMCKFVIAELNKKGIKNDSIYISFERHMECGVGQCQHCGIGGKLVCKDGPVFKFSEIEKIRGII